MITKKIQEIVERLLRDDIRCRDNDSHLAASIWWNESKNITDKNDFLELISNHKVSSYESISRCRRKLQELHPELRGKKYEERHHRQKEVKQQLKEMDADARGTNFEVNTQLEFR